MEASPPPAFGHLPRVGAVYSALGGGEEASGAALRAAILLSEEAPLRPYGALPPQAGAEKIFDLLPRLGGGAPQGRRGAGGSVEPPIHLHPMQRLVNRLHHRFGPDEHILVPEPQDAIAARA